MNRLALWQPIRSMATLASVTALSVSLTAVAQTMTAPPIKVIPPKPTIKAAPAKLGIAKPAETKNAIPTAAAASAKAKQSAVTPPPTASTSPSIQPGSSVVPSALSQTNPSALGAPSPSNALASPGSSAGDSRTPVAGQGLGTFLWPGGWTLTAYGCFRTGTRLFCDFDTTNQNNLPASTVIWSGAGGVNLVDDGGKITQRHNAFFVGDDGSQFQTAYISPQPVRFIIEYDDVDQRYTSVSLVFVRDRIQGIPVTLIDPSQPAGRMPARASASTPASGLQHTSQPGANGVLGKATQTVNNVSTQKQKAQDLLKSMQGAVQSH
jgi:hypothetical protein